MTVSTMDSKSIVVGKEVGESGTAHLQGFIKFKEMKRLSAVKKLLPRAHWEAAKGSDQQNLDYCSKEQVFIKRGVFASGSKGGGASGLALALQIGDKPFEDMSEEERCAYLRHEKYVVRSKILLDNAEAKKTSRLKFVNVVLKDWQEELVKYVQGDVSDRKVRWYVDPVGNMGKSFVSEYLECKHGAVIFENGKSNDIAYAYKNQGIVIFDLRRSQEGYFNYGVIESFKNGRLWCPKYESCVKLFKKPHVIIFSNFEPDKNQLSKDRWDIHRFGGLY